MIEILLIVTFTFSYVDSKGELLLRFTAEKLTTSSIVTLKVTNPEYYFDARDAAKASYPWIEVVMDYNYLTC